MAISLTTSGITAAGLDEAIHPDAACSEVALNQIRTITDVIQERGDNLLTLEDSLCRLEQLIFDAEQQMPHLVSNILAETCLAQKASLQQAYCKWETELEWQFAYKLMSNPDAELRDIRHYKLYERFKILIQQEVELLSSKPQRVLFIGSGPFPISGILLSQVLGVPVDCVDQDSNVVEFSRALIKKLELKDIKIFCTEGQRFDLSAYDLILIALLAKPKHAILRSIRKRGAPSCQVLCRTAFRLRTLLYEPTPIERIGGFLPIHWQVADHGQTISTYLLQLTKGISSELQWRWVNQLDQTLKDRIASLMNRVLQRETTIGFVAPLNGNEILELLTSLSESLKTGAKHLLIAETDNRIVAHLILTPHPLPNCAHQVEVSRLMICPHFRGTGLLSQIAQQLVLKSESLGRSLILLDVREGTLAHGLWKSWGFKEYGRLPDYARVNGKTHAGIFMYQEVNSLRATAFPSI